MKQGSLVLLAALVALSMSCAHGPSASEQTAAQQQRADRFVRLHKAQDEMQHNRDRAQASMLQALTPEHRGLLAQLVGDLATQPHSDVLAAVAHLNAALTPPEKQAILHIDASLRAQDQMYVGVWQHNVSAAPGAMPVPIGVARSAVKDDPGVSLLLVTTQVTFWRTAMGVRKTLVGPASNTAPSP